MGVNLYLKPINLDLYAVTPKKDQIIKIRFVKTGLDVHLFRRTKKNVLIVNSIA